MDLTNASYDIVIRAKAWTERYYRDATGWVKVSVRGRTFRATAEQVLNHILPVLAGIRPNLTIRVEHRTGARNPGEGARSAVARRRSRR